MTAIRSIQVFKSPCFVVGLFVLLVTMTVGSLVACDTPVYRYAMYRWEPAPYEVYYFHEGPVDETAAKLHEALEDVGRSEETPANLFFLSVDLKEDTELKTVPRDVRQTWQDQEEPEVPSYMVVTPYGIPIHRGALDEATLKSLIDSPARMDVVKQLAEGKAGVMVLLTGSDKKANAEAEKLLKEFVGEIASGKIELYLPPTAGFYGPTGEEEEDEGEEDEPTAPAIEVGYSKVERDSAEEKWLVDSLLSMEDDLKDEEFVDQPMMFVVFGRGRALPPCVGKGINRDNLLDCVDFITGACSCTVKDQNPGMDLLFQTDWYEVSEKVAEKYGAEEGNEYQLAAEDFFPDLVIPTAQATEGAEPEEEMATENADPNEMESAEEAADPEAKPTDEPADVGTTGDPPASEKAPSEKSEANQGDEAEQPEESETVEPGDKETPSESTTTRTPDSAVTSPATDVSGSEHASGEADGGAFGSVFLVGGGVAIAFVLLFAMTFLVLRPR